MTHRKSSNASLLEQYDDRILKNIGKVKFIEERIQALGDTFEDYKRKNSLIFEMLSIIQHTLDLQKEQSKFFPKRSNDI